MPTDNGITRSRSGGMSVSLAGPDGRVLGGGLAGLLIASGPVQVNFRNMFHKRKALATLTQKIYILFLMLTILCMHQVVVGSFLPTHNLENKSKMPRVEHNISTITHNNPPPHLNHHMSNEVSFGVVKPIMTPAAFQEENIVSFNNNVQDSRNNSSADDRDPLPEKDSNHSQSNA
jgi:hypothetical protein